MNLIYRLKLATKQVNPFIIKDQFKSKLDYASLINKQQITPDTYLLRFALSEQNKCLGTQIGQYLSLNDPQFDKDLFRFYVPISRIDDEGILDILVRAVPSEKSFSVHLSQISENTQIKLGGPFTSFLYHGFGKFTIQNQIQDYRKIGLIAEGSGIASFFQLIEGIATNGDKTHVGLLYIDDQMEDFALLEELVWLAEEKKIQVSFLSRKSKSLWSGLKGELTEHHLENYLPPPSDDTLIMISGRTSFKGMTIHNILRVDLGYDEKIEPLKWQKGKEIKKKITKPKKNLDLEEEIDSDQLEDLEENQLKTQSESEIEENDDQRRLRLAKSILQETKQELARKQKQEEYFQPVQLNEEEKRLNQALLEKLADKHTQFTQMSHKFKEPKTEIFKGHTRPITQAQIDSFGKIMFSASKDASIIKWDIETKKKTFISREIGKQQNGHSSEIYSISLNYDNKILATSSQDHTIKLWDTQANIFIETLKMHRQPVHGVKFGLNSNNIASVSADRTFMLWDASSRSYVDTFFGHSTQANDLDTLNTDDFISAGYDRQIILWKTKFGSQMIYQGHNYSIDCVRAITQDNYATGSADGSIGYWSVNKRKPLQMIPNAHSGCWITALGTYFNSDLLISGSYDGYLNFYKKGKQLELQNKIKQNGIVNSIHVSDNLIAVVESQEHRFGRWIVDKKAKNQIVLYF